MNRNRHLSEKENQKRVLSGGHHNKEFKVVTYPTHKKHVQPHNDKDWATKPKKRHDILKRSANKGA